LSRSNARSNAEPYAARASSGRSKPESSLRVLFARVESRDACSSDQSDRPRPRPRLQSATTACHVPRRRPLHFTRKGDAMASESV
jgi:hypothetical protein